MYFGMTSQKPIKRWTQHKSNANSVTRGKVDIWRLYEDMKNLGIENFEFKVLISEDSRENIGQWEYRYIQTFKTQDNRFGYNLSDGGTVNKGFKWPDESVLSVTGESNHFYGKQHSDVTKIILSMTNLGRKHSEESKLKMKGRLGPLKGVTGENHPAYGRVRPQHERDAIQINTPHRKELLMLDANTGELLMDFLSKKQAGRWLYENGLCKNSQSTSVASNITKGIKEHRPRYGYKWEEIDKSQSTIEN